MSAVHAAIAARFCAPEWATVFEARDGAGWKANRSADAVAMNLWPSRGLAVHGFEVKVSRADWLRELKDPAKSDPVQRFCDFWWIAVPDAGIVHDGELPATWGLFVLQGKKLVQRVAAPKLDAAPLTRGFIASLLRRSTEGMVPKAAVDAAVEEKLEERVKRAHDSAIYQAEHITRKYTELRNAVDAFETASGIRVHDEWRYHAKPEQVGAALRVLLGGVGRGYTGTLEQARNVATAFAREADEALTALAACNPAIHPPRDGADG